MPALERMLHVPEPPPEPLPPVEPPASVGAGAAGAGACAAGAAAWTTAAAWVVAGLGLECVGDGVSLGDGDDVGLELAEALIDEEAAACGVPPLFLADDTTPTVTTRTTMKTTAAMRIVFPQPPPGFGCGGTHCGWAGCCGYDTKVPRFTCS